MKIVGLGPSGVSGAVLGPETTITSRPRSRRGGTDDQDALPATEIERLDVIGSYGGRSLHERSHGESFLDVVMHRFGSSGLYLLDEPEAALSVRGCLALVARITDLVAQNCQFVVATHSPILLAVPGARILQIDPDGEIERVDYDQADPVALTRAFLDRPEHYLRHLLADDDAP